MRIRFDDFADRLVQSAIPCGRSRCARKPTWPARTICDPSRTAPGRAATRPHACDAWRPCRSCVPPIRSPSSWATASARSCRGRSTGWPRRCRSGSNSCPVDFRLENRRARGKAVYDEAVEAITATRVALKHPTTTAEESPNAILRRRLDLSVIHRPVYTIPGVPTNFRRELDLDIVRIATGGTYDDPGRMIGEDGAVSLRIVERRPVREAARYAFNLARKTGKRVTSSSKYTIQKATDGLFEQVAKEVAGQFPEVPHSVELFDALLGKVIMAPEKFQIVLVLNEYGDFLSDMACGLAGSLGIGASANLAFDPAAVVRVAPLRRRPRHGARHRRQEPGQPHGHLPGAVAAALPARRDQRRPGGQERDARPAPPGRPHPRPRRPGIDRQLHRGRRRRGRATAGTPRGTGRNRLRLDLIGREHRPTMQPRSTSSPSPRLMRSDRSWHRCEACCCSRRARSARWSSCLRSRCMVLPLNLAIGLRWCRHSLPRLESWALLAVIWWLVACCAIRHWPHPSVTRWAIGHAD